jgi:iron-sulfur cluster repair protein YtfE (RIC family)
MRRLIEELKEEHAEILEILGRVKELGISTSAGQERLLAARDLLLAHMRKEDERYYPGLRKAAETSNEHRLMMDYFLADMEAVSRKALRLFEKYARGGNEAEFAGEIKLLYLTLKDRISTEEETLFRKYPGP